MNKKLLFIKATFILIILSGLAWANEPSVNWEAFSGSLHTYFDYPSPDNAKAAYKLLPSSGHVRMTGAEIEMDSLEYFYSNARILERQVISGDFNAVMLAFRLFSITDAAYSEELDIMLGKLIRIHPDLFLKGLVANQDIVGGLGGLLGNEGEEYVDRLKAQCFENRERRKALQSVNDNLLIQKRDECVNELDRQWATYCGANIYMAFGCQGKNYSHRSEL